MATPFTWDDLQYFLAVARTGQLSSAARSLRTSHATVSRHIDRLEFSLKTKLFERNPRGYELTTVGRRLVDTVERIEAEAERLQSDISESGSLLRGVVRLSAPEGFSNFLRREAEGLRRHPSPHHGGNGDDPADHGAFPKGGGCGCHARSAEGRSLYQ